MYRVEGKGIAVPKELLRAGAVVSEDERGLCVYVDAEASDEVAELARRFLGGNVVSGVNAGVAWYRPLSSEPGLLGLLVGSHDDDIAKAREGQRNTDAPPADTPPAETAAVEADGDSVFARLDAGGCDMSDLDLAQGLVETLEALVEEHEEAMLCAVVRLQSLAIKLGGGLIRDELVSVSDDLTRQVGL